QHFNKKSVLLLLLVFSLIFIFYPVTGNAINIIAGPERIIYTLICFGITFCFFKGDFSYVAPYLKKTLEWLGEISYSLYLLHPLIWSLIALSSLKIRFVFPLAVIATFVICSLIYKFIEQPARNLGLKINNKK
ncbi:MAG: O-acetyl transferase, partial [Bacteroidetes bacterium]|nr:O-acetyl transferase [Bacteroidota bacterium]